MKLIPRISLFICGNAVIALIIGIIIQQPALYKPAAITTVIALAIGLGAVPALKGYRYTAWIIAAVVAGMLYPAAFTKWGDIDLRNKWLMLVIIQLVMFGMGIQMKLKDFSGLKQTGRGVVIGLLCHFSVMPLMGFLLTKLFHFEPEIAAGIILIGSTSSGLASNVMVYLARANLVLSVVVTAMATMAAPFFTPLLMKLLAGTLVQVNVVNMMMEIIKIVIVPIGAALLHDYLKIATVAGRRNVMLLFVFALVWLIALPLGWWHFLNLHIASAPLLQSIEIFGFLLGAVMAGVLYHSIAQRFPWLDRIMPYCSMFGIVYFTTVTTAAGHENLLKTGFLLFLCSVIHNAAGFFFGYWLARLFRLDKNSSRTVAFEVGLQNAGMASGLAGSMGKLGTLGLPAAVFSPWMNVAGSILANYWRRHPVAPDSEETAGGGADDTPTRRVGVSSALVLLLLLSVPTFGQTLDDAFRHPPASAKPWVFWYWMHAAVTKEGITADLEAMAQAGIGGAYLMPIKGPNDPPMTGPIISPVYEQTTPEWWQMVKFAMQEAKRLHLQIAMHVSDGFALAGGPWITPELSMQKIVWTKTYVNGGKTFNSILPQPETKENYYKDIAVYAFPSKIPDTTLTPTVTTSIPGEAPQFLTQRQTKQTFKSDSACWIQYIYPKPFTCRSIVIRTSGFNFQSRRMLIEVSNDGKNFRPVERMEPPRAGWQDNDADVTYAIHAVTARYFRFVYNKEGSEPGSEDLDAAKWKQSLKISGIELSGEPVIHQYEGKSGAVWRVSKQTTAAQAPDSLCVPLNKIINITNKMNSDGRLQWKAPAGNWTIIRIGHTSTGHTNYTGGKGKGLECDKFNPVAVKLQFDKWFGEAIRVAGPDLTKEVLKIFHVDSWECGSQNWSPVFRAEFRKRRGYDCLPYLIAMTGVPVQSAAASEKFLHDVRQTIMELVKDNFYTVLKNEVHKYGIAFSAEAIAPTMTSDGLLHYSETDLPMGEFWLRSPTHDKPNDLLDAISGAHIYGKNIVQAEAFTEIRMAWDEHPGMLKTLADRNYALGINRLVFHVFTHNPWLNRQPGMTLNGVGLYFQRNQTWWKPGKAWVEYTQRCQALLQLGRPVADVAVFTGEEIPRRAILPDRLVNSLPGIFGASVVQREQKRLANAGSPVREIPHGVYSSANMIDPEDWIDPLHGYAYDSFNPDALQLATVKNGRIVLPGGASYKILVLPGPHPMDPDHKPLSAAVANKIASLQKAGATIIRAPYTGSSFKPLGLERDVEVGGAAGIAWTHRVGEGFDLYFISNQQDVYRTVDLSLRIKGRQPELWDPVTGEQRDAKYSITNGRTQLPLYLAPNQSLFIVFRKTATTGSSEIKTVPVDTLRNTWTVQFDTAVGGPAQPVVFEQLKDWSTDTDNRIRYYSGTAVYSTTFNWNRSAEKIWLDVGKVANIAKVFVNGIDCGVVWTAPYRADISKALRRGTNELRIEVTNTWANRLSGDLDLPEDKRVTWTTAPLWLKGKPLLPAGLLGPVTLVISD